MNYDMSKLNPESDVRRISPYVSYGSGQELKINKIELKHSANTGSPRAILHMESKPVKDEGFKPLDGAKGKVGRVYGSIYMKDDKAKEGFMEVLHRIATALNLKDEIEEVKGDTFDELVRKAGDVICNGKYARYTILAEEYDKGEDKVGLSLILPRYKFVESIDTDPSGLLSFDKNNPFHYKKLKKENTSSEEPVDDLPF